MILKSVVIIVIAVICLVSLVSLNGYAETDSRITFLKSVDIRFNDIETFEVEIDGKSYNFIKLHISVYEPKPVFVDLNEFEIHEGGFSDWGTRLIADHAYDYTGFTDIKEFKNDLKKFTECSLFLEPTNIRGTIYDLNLCYENGLKMNKNYSLKFWFDSGSFKAVSFPIPSKMTQYAANVLNEKIKQENGKIQEKLKQFEAENPFKNPGVKESQKKIDSAKKASDAKALADKKLADKKLADKKLADKKLADKKLSDKKLVDAKKTKIEEEKAKK